MNAVIFNLNNHTLLDGSVFDSIEYFMYISSLTNNIRLIFITDNNIILNLQKIIQDRYIHDINYDNISCLTHIQILRLKFNNVLWFGSPLIINSNNIHYIGSWNKQISTTNVNKYTWPEFPYIDETANYKMKFLFHDYKLPFGDTMNNLIIVDCRIDNMTNGYIIDSYEYFVAMKELGCNIKMGLLNSSSRQFSELSQIIDDRYDLPKSYMDDIYPITKIDLMMEDYDNVLLPSANIDTLKHINQFIKQKNVYTILGQDEQFDNVQIFNEFPFHGDINYKMKFLLHRFKKLDYCESFAYTNFINKLKFTELELQRAIDLLKTNQKLLVSVKNYQQIPFLKDYKKYVEVIIGHPTNFFSLFDTYIYIHNGHYFDPSPRLFVESKFYNKDIIYINDYDIKDGSYYRYHDVMTNGINDRYFTKDDPLIQKFLE